MRTSIHASRIVAAMFCSAAAIGWLTAPAAAQTFTTLHKFCAKANCADGANPLQSPLIPDGAGNFFGTAQNGGANSGGVLYEMIGGTKFKALFDFPASVSPRGPLVRDIAGNLYGIAGTGNIGTGGIFRLHPNAKQTKWSYETLYTFCVAGGGCPDGQAPVELTYVGAASGSAYDGKAPLFGSTIFGGAKGDGTVFQLSRKKGVWQETVLYSFCSQASCADGMWPSYGLITDATGNLYGTTTAGGGSAGQGIVFRLAPAGKKAWTESVLYSFCKDASCTDGGQPSGLVADASGTLYGTTQTGGDASGGLSGGVLYRLVPSGGSYDYARLYSFCQQPSCADGDAPQTSMTLDSSGTLYGTTAGDSRVFAFAPQTSNYQVLHSFCPHGKCSDGVMPLSPLTLDAAGNLFGNTNSGGNQFEGGTVFEITR
ncbi:MAG: choice-of-anchor tandem repeat GloVer-containing protein [Rhizomicrobium sp.]|jgi:uncharacterized repeat protein (TIGR03803 family)